MRLRGANTRAAVNTCRFAALSQRHNNKELTMRLILITATALSLLGSVATAEAGCVTGAIVGGIAGHMVGHGGVGAAAGCAVGHHKANKKEKEQQQQAPK